MNISPYSLSLGYNVKPTNPNNSKNSVQKKDNYNSVPVLSPAYYSPSFTAMKKREFEGTDKLVVEKFKAPIQSFKTHDDFDDWANKSCEEILKKDYTARSKEATIQRKAMLKEWRQYIYEENKEYSPAQRLLILDGVTKDLNKKNDNIPPTLNPGVLADTINTLKNDLKTASSKKDYNFNKTYQNNLRMFLMSDVECSTGTDYTGWIVIPSKENDPENFKSNVEKLKALSHQSWCTKSNNAEPYLSQGDFRVYLENGNPKLGVRFVGDEIEEIQGPKNNSKIPFQYYDMCAAYVKENKFKLSNKAKDEIKQGKIFKEKYLPIMEEFKNLSSEEIFEKLGIETKKDKKGLLTLSHFYLPKEMQNDEVTYEDLGINLDELLENVKEIKGDASFSHAEINSLPNLRKIGGNADFNDSKIKDLRKLAKIIGNAEFKGTKIKDLSKLTTIGGYAWCTKAEIDDLSGLTTIGGDAGFDCCKISNLSGLTTIGENAYFRQAEIGDLSGLTEINGICRFDDSKIGNLSGLTTIKGDANFSKAEIGDLSGLTEINGNCRFDDSKIGNLSGLTTIGGGADFSKAEIKDLSGLTTIGGGASFSKAKIEDLSGLITIEGSADFTDSIIGNLKGLTTIKRNAYFCRTKIEDLSALTTIGGDANFSGAEIKDLSALTTIGEDAKFSRAKIKNLSGLTTIGGTIWGEKAQIDDMSGLITIGGSAFLNNSKIGNLSGLTTIGKNADFSKAEIEDLSGLITIGEDAYFDNSKIKSNLNLKKVERISLVGAEIPNIEELKGKFKFLKPKIKPDNIIHAGDFVIRDGMIMYSCAPRRLERIDSYPELGEV